MKPMTYSCATSMAMAAWLFAVGGLAAQNEAEIEAGCGKGVTSYPIDMRSAGKSPDRDSPGIAGSGWW